MTLTHARLVDLLHYEPSTGVFRWKVTRSRGARAGHVAGTPDKDGYVHIKIDGRVYKAHRLAWLHETGAFPVNGIDHANLVKNDNRWSNLREATKSQNMANTAPRGELGVKGVYFEKRRRHYCAQIKKNGRNIYLGSFGNIGDAGAAYEAAAKVAHREFARVAR